jgi:low molecular weight phosphotyrosine protein phosphatase
MDQSNMANIKKVAPKNTTAKIAIFGSFNDGSRTVDDPCASFFHLSLAPDLFRHAAFLVSELILPFLFLASFFLERTDYGGDDGFERVYQQCFKYSEGLLEDMGYGGEESK